MRTGIALGLLAWLAVSAVAEAHQTETRGLLVRHPWVRATGSEGNGASAYLVIINKGAHPDRLIGATLEGAGDGVIRQTVAGPAAGVCVVHPAAELAPGVPVAFKPGELFVWFPDLTDTLTPDTYVSGSLVFEHAGTVPIEFYVEAPTATEPPSEQPCLLHAGF